MAGGAFLGILWGIGALLLGLALFVGSFVLVFLLLGLLVGRKII